MIGKVATVVVTFNRKNLLLNSIDSLLKQTQKPEKIFIIDNASTDGTFELIKDKGFLRSEVDGINFEYVRMQNNEGGAGGFYKGLELAFSQGYDFAWLMDDDGHPSPTALFELMKYFPKGNKVAALNCLVVSQSNNSKLAFTLPILGSKKISKSRYLSDVQDIKNVSQDGLYPWANFFNGSLITKDAFNAVGNIYKDLFIWGDEKDYLFRLLNWGSVFTVVSSVHYHPQGDMREPSLWKSYYGLRNQLYLYRKYDQLSFLKSINLIVKKLPFYIKHRALNVYLRAIVDSAKL